jgi:hypothetical protein
MVRKGRTFHHCKQATRTSKDERLLPLLLPLLLASSAPQAGRSRCTSTVPSSFCTRTCPSARPPATILNFEFRLLIVDEPTDLLAVSFLLYQLS